MTDITAIVEKRQGQRGELLAILQDIQAKYSYLPEEALRDVAQKTGRSLVDVYGVATFYHAFSLKPRGKHLVTCCMGTACHVRGRPEGRRGAGAAAEGPGGRDDARPGVHARDGELPRGRARSARSSSSTGTTSRASGRRPSADILEKTREGLDQVDLASDERVFPVEVACARCNHSLMDPHDLIDGQPSIRVTASFGDKHGWLRLSSVCTAPSRWSREHEIPRRHGRRLLLPALQRRALGRRPVRRLRRLDGADDRPRRRRRADLLAARLPGPHARPRGDERPSASSEMTR